MLKKRHLIFVVIVAVLLSIISSVKVSNAGFFEIDDDADLSWGNTSSTLIEDISQKYTPQVSQIICSIDQKIARAGNTTGDIRLRIFSGGSNPENGILIASTSLASTAFATFPSYEKWVLNECVTLNAGQAYFFTFDRTGDLSGAGVFSRVRHHGGNQYSYTTYWSYIGVNGGWGELTAREWSLRLNGIEPFYAKLQNTPLGIWNLRSNPDIGFTNIIKTLPQGWVLEVSSTTDESDNTVAASGYRWYKVTDPTDGTIGWMALSRITTQSI